MKWRGFVTTITRAAIAVEEAAAPNRRFTLRVRAFDDGIGFRYEFPEQPGLGAFEMTDELTEFAFVDNAAGLVHPERPAAEGPDRDALRVRSAEPAPSSSRRRSRWRRATADRAS